MALKSYRLTKKKKKSKKKRRSPSGDIVRQGTGAIIGLAIFGETARAVSRI